jgi:hypothetical protein
MEVEHSSEFVPQTSLIQLLCSIISGTSTGPYEKLRAMMISGRLLSKENIYKVVEEASKIFIVFSLYWLGNEIVLFSFYVLSQQGVFRDYVMLGPVVPCLKASVCCAHKTSDEVEKLTTNCFVSECNLRKRK